MSWRFSLEIAHVGSLLQAVRRDQTNVESFNTWAERTILKQQNQKAHVLTRIQECTISHCSMACPDEDCCNFCDLYQLLTKEKAWLARSSWYVTYCALDISIADNVSSSLLAIFCVPFCEQFVQIEIVRGWLYRGLEPTLLGPPAHVILYNVACVIHL